MSHCTLTYLQAGELFGFGYIWTKECICHSLCTPFNVYIIQCIHHSLFSVGLLYCGFGVQYTHGMTFQQTMHSQRGSPAITLPSMAPLIVVGAHFLASFSLKARASGVHGFSRTLDKSFKLLVFKFLN